MGRRRRALTTIVPGKALASGALDNALTRINELRDNVVRTTLSFDLTRSDIIDMIFTDHTKRLMCESYGVIRQNPICPYYELYATTEGLQFEVQLYNMTEAHRLCEPEPKVAVHVNTEKRAVLQPMLRKLNEIYEDWRAVYYVVTKLNDTCTNKAIRAYWPTVLSLSPGCAPNEMPASYKEPAQLGIPPALLRETADTVVAGLMAPKAEVPSIATNAPHIRIKIVDHSFERHGVRIDMGGDDIVRV